MWSECGRNVVGMVGTWSERGRNVVGTWSERGRQWSEPMFSFVVSMNAVLMRFMWQTYILTLKYLRIKDFCSIWLQMCQDQSEPGLCGVIQLNK